MGLVSLLLPMEGGSARQCAFPHPQIYRQVVLLNVSQALHMRRQGLAVESGWTGQITMVY